MSEYEKLQKALACIREKTDFVPDIGLVLGSGLGALADEIETAAVVDYKEIEGFPVSTVPGHKGRFVFGYIGDAKVVVMQGRVHYYEGYPVSDVVMPARLIGLMGAKVLFLTNASGGINGDYYAGDFMLIKDQIMSFFPNPLVGPNIDELGPRFPDATDLYDSKIRAIIKAVAGKLDINLKEGVYIQFTGPSFESPAEVRMAGMLGADAVGMSSVPEAIVARHAGIEVVGISFLSNWAAGIIKNKELNGQEVTDNGIKIGKMFEQVVNIAVTE